jgi:Domain of unknown function (DUF4371)/hAT family C-terminal dimerisation region
MSQDHNDASKSYMDYKSSKSVLCQLSEEADKRQTQKQIQITKNRSIVGRLFDVSRLLGKLGLPFRGHREDEDSENKGLFLELVHFLAASGDTILNDHLQHMSANATYLSSTIQNDMIDVIGNAILTIVIANVKKARIYSILMDETTDNSHCEQVSIMVRFVDVDAVDVDKVVCERLIGVVRADATTGEALTKLLLDVLDKVNLSVNDVVGQGYDGGANMRGSAKGVQARIKELNPRAMYTHCFAHCLNRALVNAVCSREHAGARNFFGIVELVFTFTEGSAMRHQYYIDVQERLLSLSGNKGPALHLKGLSETRWNCRAESLKRLAKLEVYEAVVETVEHVSNTTSDGTVRGVAAGLKNSLMDYTFILQLFAMQPVFELINETSVLLQSTQLDLLQANSHIEALSAELLILRTDSAWVVASSKAKTLADKLNVETELAVPRERKVPRRLLENSGVSALVRDRTVAADPSAVLRAEYFALLDRLSTEVADRFPKSLQLFAPLQCKNMDMLDAESCLSNLSESYDLGDKFLTQWRLFRRNCGRSPSTTIAAAYLKVPPEHIELRKAYQILLTLPVTSAGVERSFSKLSLIKSKLRTTMTQSRLQSLMLAAIEKDILAKLSIDNLVSQFAASSNRRLDLG